MNKAEILDLMAEIKENYPFFDISEQKVNFLMEHLSDISFELAQQNLKRHFQTNRYEPTIADLRAGIEGQRERVRSLEDTAKHFDQLEEYRRNAVPPPPGNKAKIMAILQGGDS